MHCSFCSPEPNAFREPNFNLLVLSSRLCQQRDELRACEKPPSIPTKWVCSHLSCTIYFGPLASHPLNGDLNFRINTFLTDSSEGWRTLKASIETLLVRCGTQLWNIYIHFGSWQSQSESNLATRAHEPTCVSIGAALWTGRFQTSIFVSEISEILPRMCCANQVCVCVCDWEN